MMQINPCPQRNLHAFINAPADRVTAKTARIDGRERASRPLRPETLFRNDAARRRNDAARVAGRRRAR